MSHKKAARQLRSDAYLVGVRDIHGRNTCRRCGQQIFNCLHPRLSCPKMEAYMTTSHDRAVQVVAESIRAQPEPPTYVYVSAGSKEGPGSMDSSPIPVELLPHSAGIPHDRPDIVCIWVTGDAWGGPGTKVSNPAGIRILLIEVGVARELTLWRPTPPTLAGEKERPGGGLRAMHEFKCKRYGPLMAELFARGYQVMGTLPNPPDPLGRFVFQPGEVRSLWGTVTRSVIHVMALGAADCITKATVEAFEAAGVVGGLLETAIAKLQLVLVEDTASALVIHHRESAKLLLSQGAPGGGAPASPGAPRVVTVDPP